MAAAESSNNSKGPTRAIAAESIAVEASRLARLAKQNEFSLLAYLIDMAVLEAWREAGEGSTDPGVLEDT